MSPEEIQQLRLTIFTNVSRMPGIIMDRNDKIPDYDSDIAHLNDLEIVIEQIESILKMGKEAASIILGKEFHPVDVEQENVLPVPLYLYLDVIMAVTTYAMNNTAKLDERKHALLARLEKCRDKAAKLPHHPHFHSKKHLSKYAIESILHSKGNYQFSILKSENKRYVSILSALSQQMIGGNESQATYIYREDAAFQEDYNRIKIRESERYINYIKEIQNHIKKYFKNNSIPDSTSTFSQSLIDPGIDDSIKMSLFTIIEQLSHESANTSQATLDQTFKNLCNQEAMVAKKQMESIASTFGQQALVEQNHINSGIFKRFEGVLPPKNNQYDQQQVIEFFEGVRKEQILQDEETRNRYLPQKQVINPNTASINGNRGIIR